MTPTFMLGCLWLFLEYWSELNVEEWVLVLLLWRQLIGLVMLNEGRLRRHDGERTNVLFGSHPSSERITLRWLHDALSMTDIVVVIGADRRRPLGERVFADRTACVILTATIAVDHDMGDRVASPVRVMIAVVVALMLLDRVKVQVMHVDRLPLASLFCRLNLADELTNRHSRLWVNDLWRAVATSLFYNHVWLCFAILHGIRARLLIAAHLRLRETCQLNLWSTFVLNILMDELDLAPLVLANAGSSSLPEFCFFEAVISKWDVVFLTRGSLFVTPHYQSLTDDPVALAMETTHVPARSVTLCMLELWFAWHEEWYSTFYRLQL